jgi:glutamate racemase
LTVLREILRRLPFESTIYLGDNARAPYGVRTDDEVRRYSVQALDALVRRDVKALVVACNTSTSVALGDFRRRYDLPVLGVVRPGAAAAALATRNRRVGVIATPATVRSRAYFNAIKDENPAVEVYEHATPSLVPLVEAGLLSGPAVEEAVRSAVAPLLGERNEDGDFIFPLWPSSTPLPPPLHLWRSCCLSTRWRRRGRLAAQPPTRAWPVIRLRGRWRRFRRICSSRPVTLLCFGR